VTTVLWLLAGLLLLAALLIAHVTFWTRRLARAVEYAETLRLPTPDGSAFELRHLRPQGEPHATPVLLVHGIAINHRNMDSDAQWSLARMLAASGRDTWLLTLRSGRSDLTWAERRAARFSAMAHHDVPLAVQEVLRRTGASSLDYIGFSMGGMLAYATLGRTVPEAQVRRAVIIGSPGRVVTGLPVPRWLARLPFPGVPLRWPSRAFAFASEWLHTPIHSQIVHMRNVAPGLTRHTLVDAVQDIPAGLLQEFAQWAAHGGAITVDGVNVLVALRKVNVPVQFFVGTVDRLGPASAVQVAYEAWGADSGVAKRLTILGRAHGQAEDYGHADLAIGMRAPTEFYPLIRDFLGAPAVVSEVVTA
jgi:polyhydroxyalkanoate synthase